MWHDKRATSVAAKGRFSEHRIRSPAKGSRPDLDDLDEVFTNRNRPVAPPPKKAVLTSVNSYRQLFSPNVIWFLYFQACSVLNLGEDQRMHV